MEPGSFDAGLLRERVRIERRAAGDDGYGNVLDGWETVAERWAGWRPQFGREVVAGGVSSATRSGTVTMRRDSVTATVTAADRLVFLVGPEADTVAQVRSVIPVGRDAIEMVVEIGVGD